MRVKICGVTTVEDAKFIESCGADALGVVISDESLRNVTFERAGEIFSALGPFIAKVVVTHTTSPEELERIAALSPTAIQISTDLTMPEGYRGSVIRVVKPGMSVPDSCDAVILDESRGCGILYNGSAAKEFVRSAKVPLILAGGLNPSNVAAAIDEVHPYAVDVCSGVELRLGIKDKQKVMEFLKACGKMPELKLKSRYVNNL